MLKNNVFHVESQWPDVLRELLNNPKIRAARVHDESSTCEQAPSSSSNTSQKAAEGFLVSMAPREDRREVQLFLLDDDREDELDPVGPLGPADDKQSDLRAQGLNTVSFMVAQQQVQVPVY